MCPTFFLPDTAGRLGRRNSRRTGRLGLPRLESLAYVAAPETGALRLIPAELACELFRLKGRTPVIRVHSWLTDFLCSIHLALAQDMPIRLPRVLVVLLRLLHFVGLDELLLLRPALVHAFETPFGAPFRRANRPVADQQEHRVRVG